VAPRLEARREEEGVEMQHVLYRLAAVCVFGLLPLTTSAARTTTPGDTTIILVHGAFAESASWDGVITDLTSHGYKVVAAAIPMRGLGTDAADVSSLVKSIHGRVVLVGHSYGGAVISVAGTANSNVAALVYVAGLATDAGESASDLTKRFPGSTLGAALAPPVILADGSKDLYIQQSKYNAQFAADVPAWKATQMAATQRPIAAAALTEPAGPPAWKNVPSWFIYGSADKNIPPAVQPFMAARAGAEKVVEVKGASHSVMVSHPHEVAALIEQAAAKQK
jgi:pimeloyl-ACP methyl ester carboxylesterase